MLDLSDTTLNDDDVKVLAGTLYTKAGLRPTDHMSLELFKKVFASDEYEKTLECATLQLQDAKEECTYCFQPVDDVLSFVLAIFNAGVYMTFKSNFHEILNYSSSMLCSVATRLVA